MLSDLEQLFTIKPNSLEVSNLQALLLLLKYDPSVRKTFPAGFKLAEPINNKTGGILYPKAFELTSESLERLLKLGEVNPDYNFSISIEKSSNIRDYFKEKIKSDFFKLISAKKRKNEFRKSIGKTEHTIKMFIDDILGGDDLVFTIYKLKCIDEASSKSGIPVFYNHAINEVILSTNIFHNALYNLGLKFTSEDYKNISHAALLHNYKGIETRNRYKEFKLEDKKKRYIQENSQSHQVAECLSLNSDVIKSIKLCNSYYTGNRDFIKRCEDKPSAYANIVLTADLMDEKTTGLFGEPITPWNAADQLYVMAESGELRRGYIDALTKSLKLDSLFDFYYEIERLTKMCLFKTSARPYPMLGFKSPVIFLCKDKRTNCKEYGASIKSVHVFKANSGLKPGVYGRCNMLSNKLINFYKTHYKDIKEETYLTQTEKISERKKNKP